VKDKGVRASRQQFILTKEKVETDKSKLFDSKSGNLGNNGNLDHSYEITQSTL